MGNLTTLFLVLLASAISAVIGIWYGSRLREEKISAALALGRSEFAVETTRNQERSNALEAQLRQTQTRCSDAESALRANELRLIGTLEAGARFEERASKVEPLERMLESANNELTDSRAALASERETVVGAIARVEAAEIRTNRAEQALVNLSRDHSQIQNELTGLKESGAELRAALQSEKEKIQILMTAREDLLSQFKVSASEILDDKSKQFAERNIEALGNLLNPVKEKLAGFQAKVEEVYRTEGQERAALGEQLKHLLGLNQTLSQDAKNLTRALKGDRKTQGVWGEVLLDSVLEMAGLIEGTHFERQSTYESQEQKRNVPDIVLRLPGDRHLVIDSKVSLTAYEQCMSSESSDDRAAHLRQHIASVRAHIKNLSEKRYQNLYGLKSLDFVLLFVPLEPAFATAVSNDNQIFREAWDRNIILVSPSTMLFVVRTVAYLWRQDAQTRNVIEIARRGGELYDKFCGFIEDLELVGQRIDQARTAYDSSFKKLSTGQGNLVRQAQMLRDLGLKPTKTLSPSVVEISLES
jgi:DNA recombination protein RmuC